MTMPFLDLFKVSHESKNQLKFILPYSFIISPSLCLLKNGAIMTCFEVGYPDLESSGASEIANESAMFNRQIMQLGQNEGWAIFFEAKRSKTKWYPRGQFTNLAGWLIDQRRAENFQKLENHFATEYYITFVQQLAKDLEGKTKSIFFKKTNARKNTQKIENSNSWKMFQEEIKNFNDEVEKTMGAMKQTIYYRRLDNSELFSYIKSSVSLIQQNLIFPHDVFFFLDDYITDQEVHTSLPLKIGEYYVPIITIMDFPTQTYPAIFDELNKISLEYRWVTRFIPLSKELALKEAKKYQKRMMSGRKSGLTYFMEAALNTSIDNENQGAIEMEAEAKTIQAEITMRQYTLGYYTTNFMVWDKNLKVANEKAKKVQQIIRAAGFTVKEETFNNLEAWLSMLPGNVYANIRRPIINSANTSHVIPLSAAWQGNLHNSFTEETSGSPTPLIIGSTNYNTAFFLNLNVGDVGHTVILGPTGAGKSTLLALIMSSATKYENANIICIDKQLSSRALIVSHGGIYVEPGKDAVAFQPLSELKNPDECSPAEYQESLMWCQQFIEALLLEQNIECTPEISSAINETLLLLSKKATNMHDLTSFQEYVNYTDRDTGANTIRTGINPYCRGGAFGSVFDAEETNLHLSKLMTIEMGTLMRLSEKAVAPALMYIFRYLENLWNVPANEKQPLTFLILDEAWLYLQHKVFANIIQEWLRTLRKKKVFCIFATQEVSAISKSLLKDTIMQQCLTKIYLADNNAKMLANEYAQFGLTPTEIQKLSEATMKHDYYFKNPIGSRMFSLDLDDLQLALISSDHELLTNVENQFGRNTGKELAFEILEATKEKYIARGKNPYALDYTKYKNFLDTMNGGSYEKN